MWHCGDFSIFCDAFLTGQFDICSCANSKLLGISINAEDFLEDTADSYLN
jgi:hypothetical protein